MRSGTIECLLEDLSADGGTPTVAGFGSPRTGFNSTVNQPHGAENSTYSDTSAAVNATDGFGISDVFHSGNFLSILSFVFRC